MRTEILAPAGNIDSLKAAVLYGADAVYFGLSDFNARIKADNFSFDNLGEWVDFCHLYGVKVYITLNTIVKNNELNKLKEFIYKATTCNVDAFIVTDIATITLCKKICPNIPLHFSTQFGVHNLEGAIRAKKLGASRVILSRETPLSEIKRIISGVDIEVEAFVHGAMCVSFSGNCYLSSFLDRNSGNRGRCKQPCRLKCSSSITDENGYYLSMKDLCLIDRVRELADIGVVSLKIEGRLKSAEYVASSVVAYKNALLGKKNKADLDNLKSTYSRVSTNNGYLDGAKCDIITSLIQNNTGLEIGRVCKTERLKNGLNKIYFSSNRVLSKGDGLKIINNDIELCGAELTSILKENGLYVLYVSKNAPVGSKVSLTQNTNIFNELEKIRIPVDFKLTEIERAKYRLSLSDGQNTVCEYFSVDDNQISVNDVEVNVRKVLGKGLDPFTVQNVYVDLITETFVPNSVLNNCRKECKNKLAKARIDLFKKIEPEKIDIAFYNQKNSDLNRVAVIIDDVKKVTESLLNITDDVIYMPFDYNNINLDKLFLLCRNKRVYFGIPTILMQKDIEVLYKAIEKYNTLLFGVYGNGQFCKEIADKYNLEFFAGFGLNIVNDISANEYKRFVYSIELNGDEIKSMNPNGYFYSYGSPELMYFAHCPNYASGKNCSSCSFDKGDVNYNLNTNKYVIKRIKIQNCYFGLFDRSPICLFDKIDKVNRNILLDLRGDDDVDFILDNFSSSKRIQNSNLGHYNKGVL